ncbi:restriction endonuclease subunit S [Euzebyella marina]|uniref:Restriction endonuclease subunit S n=1 Tax=Euzebyella marina TaxID=1761453 RepID=A0A3G2L5C0_9FLAO|nr:restriction endonuclease subunit S [Euzebyella marina]AYN67465.1 restriction endonuclease subunit S [Euzebyella marina]
MSSNYKKLGDYIQPVNKRNTDLKVETLLGVSIQKILMPSIANTVGTNMKTYKIIEKNQFAYGPVTSRNGDKISIALLQDYDEAIISQAYTVFEVIDKNELNPEYLMMWFGRPEFDRYARFKSHGSARETFDWDELCEVELPIPSIEKQREIVNEYNTVTNRIELNEQLNQKLEETAQALYKHWFVDFEFPNEEGKPYKSSGGEMVFNDELDKEIPVGWRVERLEKLTKKVCVGFVGSLYDSYCSKDEGIPMLRTTDLTSQGMSYKDLKYVNKKFHSKHIKSQLKKGDILVARHGTNGMPVIFDADFEANCLNTIIIKPDELRISSKLIYCYLNSIETKKQIQGSLGGSVQSVLNTKIISNLFFFNSNEITDLISRKLRFFQSEIERKRSQLFQLEELQSLLLAKMTKVELKHYCSQR